VPHISQAKSSDTSKVAQFLDHASLIQRHLDWTPLLDWIETSPFLQYIEEDRLHGILVCPPDPVNVSWIKCFACNTPVKVNEIFASLLFQARKLLSNEVDYFYALGLQDWFIKILDHTGFIKFQDVVILTLIQSAFKKSQTRKAFIRPMELNDIESVALVDHQSFEPIWTISTKSLEAAFFQSAHASVAEMDGEIVGYELSTANNFSAHLARVAVLPQFQHEHLGYQLVEEMIGSFLRRGISAITVNTQSTNHASLQLYKKIGFKPTGDQFPVYRLSV
jgi:[ribosomal protein S18]-alanine N-acetyltransferase